MAVIASEGGMRKGQARDADAAEKREVTLDAAAAVYFAREIEGVCNDDAMALRRDFNSAVRSGTRAFLHARILQLGRYGSGQQPDAKHFKNLLPLQRIKTRTSA